MTGTSIVAPISELAMRSPGGARERPAAQPRQLLEEARDLLAGAIDADAYAGRWTQAAIDDLHQSIHGLGQPEDRLDAFFRFSDLEQRIEHFEREVRPLTVFVDRSVQDEIDRMRGR